MRWAKYIAPAARPRVFLTRTATGVRTIRGGARKFAFIMLNYFRLKSLVPGRRTAPR